MIVPHTHWDREWYAPFQAFRLRLVDLLDSFLPALEADLGYAHFLLDGQMAVVDDYLAVRPEAEARLRRLAASGRVAMGPWYVLMDEFLVSGETMVRDLQLGLEKATAFGGAMEVGYLPDMFGHVAQMPQLLAEAGIGHAVVWRGVPAAIGRTAFWWAAPDGSTVRAEYLRHGYGNGASIPDDAKALVARLAAHQAELGGALPPGAPLLFMNGTDHEVPQPWLGRVVAEANQVQDDFDLVVTSLQDYLNAAPTAGLPRWTGELRSGARANLLMGVASNRVDVKQAAARAERALERRAEPLAALYHEPGDWPGTVLALAWREVIANAAHDSVCACSADEVGAAVLHRYAEARQVAEGVAQRALAALAASMAVAGPVVVNPSARPRGGVVELVIPGPGGVGPGDGPGDGMGGRPEAGLEQVVEERAAVLADLHLVGHQLGEVLGRLRSQQLDERTYVNRIDVDDEEDGDGLEIVLHADAQLTDNLMVDEVKRDLYARAGARPEGPVHVRIQQPASRRILVREAEVPGFGWAAWPGPKQATVEGPAGVSVEGATMANGLVAVTVGPDGFTLDGRPGFDRLVDSGDHGDTYNYSPPDHDLMVDQPLASRVTVLEPGPVRARLRLERDYEWPAAVDGATRARVGTRSVTVASVYELRAGERLVRVEASFDNPSRDHRLRAHFPLPEPAAASRAECAFAVVERGLTAEGGPTERALPTWPSRRFVQAGGLTVVHEGLLEYELVDLDEGADNGRDDGAGAGVAGFRARSLALTLLRATGMLSRVEMAYRPLPAGPPLPLDGPQLPGAQSVRYGVATGPVDPWALVDDAFLPLEVVVAPGGGWRGERGSALEVAGAEVSALRRVPGALELRVWNPSHQPTTVEVGRRGWLVDLRGRPRQPFDGHFPLRPWGIATAHLDEG